jgi:hypothetical protein
MYTYADVVMTCGEEQRHQDVCGVFVGFSE